MATTTPPVATRTSELLRPPKSRSTTDRAVGCLPARHQKHASVHAGGLLAAGRIQDSQTNAAALPDPRNLGSLLPAWARQPRLPLRVLVALAFASQNRPPRTPPMRRQHCSVWRRAGAVGDSRVGDEAGADGRGEPDLPFRAKRETCRSQPNTPGATASGHHIDTKRARSASVRCGRGARPFRFTLRRDGSRSGCRVGLCGRLASRSRCATGPHRWSRADLSCSTRESALPR